MRNKMDSVPDVQELLRFLSGATSLSSAIQQECKAAEKILENPANAVTPQIVLSTASTPAVATGPGVVAAYQALQARPWKHGCFNITVSGSSYYMTGVAQWLDTANSPVIISEIEHIEKQGQGPGAVYEVLYRYKK